MRITLEAAASEILSLTNDGGRLCELPPLSMGQQALPESKSERNISMSAAFCQNFITLCTLHFVSLSGDVREHRRQIRALRRARMYDMIGRRARGTQYRQRAPLRLRRLVEHPHKAAALRHRRRA